MDEVDAAILQELRRDARAPYVAIARAAGASEATVRARVKRLQEEGVIQAFTIRVGGAAVRAMVEVAIRSNVETGDVSARIHALPGVLEVWEVTGDHDIVAIVDVASTVELNALVDAIRRLGDITATRTRVILSEKF